MPAEIEKMFSVREMPWHRQGEVREDYPQNFTEARKLAGLDWDPVAIPTAARMVGAEALRSDFREVLTQSPYISVADSLDKLERLFSRATEPDPEWSRIARDDTGATLSYQRSSYKIIPNSAFGEIIDSVVGSEDGKVKLETGGSLAGGRKVWMLARLDEPMMVEAGGRRDESYTFPFLGLTSDHTGSGSLSARLTTVRIVCANTFSAAEAEGKRTGAVYSFSHRGDWKARLDDARNALMFARNEAREYTAAMSDLLGIRITPEQEQLWLREFIPEPPEGLISDRVAANIDEARSAIMGFLNGITVEGAGIRGTAYGLVQAAGEYLDHTRRARTWESRLNRSLLSQEPMKAKAASLARAAALL